MSKLRFDPAVATAGGPLPISLTGRGLLSNPLLNKGTAFSDEERDLFGLHGQLPPHVSTIHYQINRRLAGIRHLQDDLERYVYLRGLLDSNETLFYALVTQNLEETLPIIYTPTVGRGCQEFSHIYKRPRGLFVSYPLKDRMKQIFEDPAFDHVECIVVSDGERILGLGDQGAGGMGIPIGKLSLYTACAGLHPATTLPILLDVGTDNEDRLNDPFYIGWNHHRVRGEEYDAFIEAFIEAVIDRWPHVLLQWEDFAKANATRLLERYRDRLCTFNDDVQGTAAVATAAVLAAVGATGKPLKEQKVCVVGAGSAGCGIASLLMKAMTEEGLTEEEARERFYLVDMHGLVLESMPDLWEQQKPFAKSNAHVEGWVRQKNGDIGLGDAIVHGKPSILIGTSGQPGTFTETIIRQMAEDHEHPIVFPLSNQTSRAEATPADIDAWTGGRAVIGTGSPFPALERNGKPFKVDQTNNSYIFPGVGLGVIACKARRISDEMMMAAARAVASISPARDDPNANLLPPVKDLRRVALVVAKQVARKAKEQGLCPDFDDEHLETMIEAKMWEPDYIPYQRLGGEDD